MRKTKTVSILADSGKADHESIPAESGDRRPTAAKVLRPFGTAPVPS